MIFVRGSTVFSRVFILKSFSLRGIVFSGHGEGEKFVALSWVRVQVEEKVGFKPYPGTLNLKLSQRSLHVRKKLEQAVSSRICPPKGYCSGIVSAASIGNLKAAIIIPEMKDYPEDVLEIIAPVNLRDFLVVKDGDEVVVRIKI